MFVVTLKKGRAQKGGRRRDMLCVGGVQRGAGAVHQRAERHGGRRGQRQ